VDFAYNDPVGNKPKAFIAGGTGFIGVHLGNRLQGRGYEVTVMGQKGDRPPSLDPSITLVRGDGRKSGSWQEHVADSSLIVNLAGASIFNRWTAVRKDLIRESRILTTRRIVDALPEDAGEVTLFSTSAVGYYGFRGDEGLTEDSAPGDDFLALLCRDWEDEARRASTSKGARVVITRFGIVLGKKGGALGQMLPLFRSFLGGPLGDGRQWFSWIHMEDLLGAYSFLLGRNDAEGPYNLSSPVPVRNGDLARSIGKALHRPSFARAPSAMVRLALGEFGNVVLKGQRVVPARLLDAGYGFTYERIDEALPSVI
jgi:hypothetical protein